MSGISSPESNTAKTTITIILFGSRENRRNLTKV